MLTIGVADRHAAEQQLFVGCTAEPAHAGVVYRPCLLGARVDARFLGEQHERLEEHPEIGPLRRTHPAVDEAEQSGRCAEEVEVLGELGEPARSVVAGDADRGVQLLADGETVAAIRLPQIGGIDVVLARLDRLIGDERLEARSSIRR